MPSAASQNIPALESRDAVEVVGQSVISWWR